MSKLFLFSLSFSLGIGTSVTEILVTISPLLAQKILSSQEDLGTSFSIYFAALSASTLTLSFMPLRVSMRRLLIMGITGFFISLLGMFVIYNLNILYLCRLLQGLSAGLLQTLAVSIVKQADKNPSAHKALAKQSVLSEAIGLPMPIISGFMVGIGLWSVPFVILALIAFIMWVSFCREKTELLDMPFHSESAHRFLFLKQKQFFRPALLGGLSNGLAWGVVALLSFVIQENYHLSAFKFGIIQALYMLLYIVGSYLSGKAVNSWASIRMGNLFLIIGIGLAFLFKFTQWVPCLIFVGGYVYLVAGYFYSPCLDLSQSVGNKSAVPKITAVYITIRLIFSAVLTWAFSFIPGGTALFENILILAFLLPLALSIWTQNCIKIPSVLNEDCQ